MVSLPRISQRVLVLVASLFFACLGAFDIISDLVAHQLTPLAAIINSLFFVPLVFRHRLVFRVFGWLAVCFAAYGGLAIMSFFFQHLHGRHMPYPFDTFVIGPLFMLAIATAGIILIRAGKPKVPFVANNRY